MIVTIIYIIGGYLFLKTHRDMIIDLVNALVADNDNDAFEAIIDEHSPHKVASILFLPVIVCALLYLATHKGRILKKIILYLPMEKCIRTRVEITKFMRIGASTAGGHIQVFRCNRKSILPNNWKKEPITGAMMRTVKRELDKRNEEIDRIKRKKDHEK